MRGLIFLTCFLFCSTVTAMSIQTILQQKGQPDWILTAPNGNKFYYYNIAIKQTFPSYTTSVIVVPGGHAIGINVPSTANQPVYMPKCLIVYEVNKKGMVVDMQASGNC